MATSGTNSTFAADLLVELRRDAPVPLHRQLEQAIREAVRSGRLRAGTAMPASRTLAADLGVSRGVVVEAYEQLVAEGYLTSRSGGYTRVAVDREPNRSASRPVGAAQHRIDFRYGRPDVSQFPRAAWLRSVRRVLNEAPSDRFAYVGGRGAPELHSALADYLNRVRGTAAHPERVLVCQGYTQGLSLLMQVLSRRGATTVAVEDPSDETIRQIIEHAGLAVVGVPVGPDGLRADLLADCVADALVLTAAHQCPTGVVLSAQNRAGVLDWAERRGAIVVEDDYDAEYRYDRAPVGAVQGLAPDHVVYAGSASKTLAPGLRLGWLLLPAHLVDDVVAAKEVADLGSPGLDQLVFADFLARGEFDRHLRRMRAVYRQRRDTLLDALHRRLPELRPAGASAGLHVLTWLPEALDESAVVAAAAARGLGVYGVAPYRLNGPGPGGLLFGYGAVGERAVVEGVELLAEVMTPMYGARRISAGARS